MSVYFFYTHKRKLFSEKAKLRNKMKDINWLISECSCKPHICDLDYILEKKLAEWRKQNIINKINTYFIDLIEWNLEVVCLPWGL